MNNSSYYLHSGYCDFSTPSQKLDAFLFTLISLLAIVGNIFIILVYKQQRVLRNTTNVFIISLSASDMFVGFLSIPYSFSVFLCGVLPTSHTGMEHLLYKVCDMLPSILSIYSLSLVAIDRAIAVGLPFLHKQYVNQRSASISVVIVWFASFGVVILIFIMDAKQFTLLAILIAYVIPVTIMIVSYVIVGYVAKKHAKDINKLERTKSRFKMTYSDSPELSRVQERDNKALDSNDSTDSLIPASATGSAVPSRRNSSRDVTEATVVPVPFQWLPTPRYSKRSCVNLSVRCLWREIKAALKLSFILACFVASWTPFMALNIEHFLDPNCHIGMATVKYFKLLHYSNSALNPILYVLLNKTWKTVVKMTLSCSQTQRTILHQKSVIGW